MPVTSVDQYIETHPTWEEELRLLREILLGTELEENIKWGAPVYSLKGKNVIGIAAFKNHCALWFFNGALLQENTALLHNAQEDKTKALRQIRFEQGEEIKPRILQKYISEAILNQKEGKIIKAENKTNKEVVIPSTLQKAFQNDSNFKVAFEKLTPGKQREYATHIMEAKREETKLSRLEKIRPMIIEGKGLHDKYKNC